MSEQRAFAVKAYYDSFVGIQRAFRRQFGLSSRGPVPSPDTNDQEVKNFETTGSTIRKRNGSENTSQTPENIERERDVYELTHSPKNGW